MRGCRGRRATGGQRPVRAGHGRGDQWAARRPDLRGGGAAGRHPAVRRRAEGQGRLRAGRARGVAVLDLRRRAVGADRGAGADLRGGGGAGRPAAGAAGPRRTGRHLHGADAVHPPGDPPGLQPAAGGGLRRQRHHAGDAVPLSRRQRPDVGRGPGHADLAGDDRSAGLALHQLVQPQRQHRRPDGAGALPLPGDRDQRAAAGEHPDRFARRARRCDGHPDLGGVGAQAGRPTGELAETVRRRDADRPGSHRLGGQHTGAGVRGRRAAVAAAVLHRSAERDHGGVQ